MWRVVLAIVIAVALGFAGLEIANWFLRGSASLLADLLGLTIAAVAFWLIYRFFADMVDDHNKKQAQEKAVKDAYQAGIEEGRRQALQGQNDAG